MTWKALNTFIGQRPYHQSTVVLKILLWFCKHLVLAWLDVFKVLGIVCWLTEVTNHNIQICNFNLCQFCFSSKINYLFLKIRHFYYSKAKERSPQLITHRQPLYVILDLLSRHIRQALRGLLKSFCQRKTKGTFLIHYMYQCIFFYEQLFFFSPKSSYVQKFPV